MVYIWGFMIAKEYFATKLTFMIKIIGILFVLQCFKLGVLVLSIGHRAKVAENTSICLNLVMNIIWIIIGGFWIALAHVLCCVFFCLTIVGIPFGKIIA